jgi:hypothetical protein
VGAVPTLQLFGVVAGGWQLLRSAKIAEEKLGQGGAGGEAAFYEAKISTAEFFTHHVLCQASGLAQSIAFGGAAALAEAL